MAKIFRGGETQFRIRIGALGATEPGRVLFEGEFFDTAAPVGGGAATWHTPSAPFAVTPASPPQYYQATLAWSYRHDPGEINYPRVTNRMLLSDQGTFLNIQDGDDTAGRQFIAQAISWGWSNVYLTSLVSGFLKPSQTHNFVMLFSQTGALSGGNTVQLWCNGTLVASTSTVLSDFSLYSMTLLGEGSTVLPGETQGFWFSGDTAIAPATVFADLFDGTNGMLDINADPTVGGVTPDNYYIEPGSGGSTFDRAAAVVSDSTVTAAATKTTASAAAISSDSTVTAVGQRIQQRTVAIQSDSAASATSTLTQARAAVVQSDSAVSATGTLTQVRSASVQSDTTVTAASTLTLTRSSAIQSDSTVSAEAQGDIPRSASIQSDSTVSAVGNLTITRAAAIQSDSTLTAAALGQIDRAASIASDSTITAAWIRIFDRAASIQSDSAISASAAAASVHVLPRVIAAVHPGRMMCR